jgi:hypothetical protein
MNQGCALGLTGKASHAVQIITAGITAWPRASPYFDVAGPCPVPITAVETTKERRWEAEINRTAGEIALSPERDTVKAQAYFERGTGHIMRRLCITHWKWGKSSGEHPIAVRSASVKNASCRNAEETGTASSGCDFALTRLAFVTAKCPRYIRSAGLAPRH